MARTRRIKEEGAAFYHVTSRITGRQFLLKDPEVKMLMLSALKRSAKFSGVEIGSFCIMDDHFHILLHIPSFDAGTLPDSELLDRKSGECPQLKNSPLSQARTEPPRPPAPERQCASLTYPHRGV